MIVVLVIELTNYASVMTSNSYREIVINLIILVLVSQFDDFFYQTFADTGLKKVLRGYNEHYTDMLKVQQTTSIQARHRVAGNKVQL